MLLTLNDVRRQLWQFYPCSASSVQVDWQDATYEHQQFWLGGLNRVLEYFYGHGEWKNMYYRVPLTIQGTTLTLPRNYGNCVGCAPATGPTFPIYSRFHEFSAWGTALANVTTYPSINRGLIPLGDTAQTFKVPTGTFYLRAVATEVMTEGLTFLGGTDGSDNEIFAPVTLDLASGTTTTSQAYNSLPLIEKKVTQNAVKLYSVDTTSAVATLIATYAPGETIPSYKQFSVPSATDQDVVTALCTLQYVPVVADTDLVVPSNTNAIALGLQALTYRDFRNDPERAALYMGPNKLGTDDIGKFEGAIDILDSDRQQADAGEVPLFNMGRQFGAGSIISVR